MKERPILFIAAMVRAILAGTKTQTRRVVKRVSSDCIGFFDDGDGEWAQRFMDERGSPYLKAWRDRCPYGQPGDRLWVRETFYHDPEDRLMLYRADDDFDGDQVDAGFKWHPSIFMPRKLSRLTLEITGVRAEQLQDISEADAIAEGVGPGGLSGGMFGAPGLGRSHYFATARDAYCALWESINGAGSWDANPWVWVIELKVLA